ncbi:MAG: restriction endonuclease, partial [Saezia sp.]
MPVLDFKEISEAKGGGDRQDNFELFARDFFAYKGLKIIEEPNRGADGGKDLIVEETRYGAVGSSTLRWLVSCKHYAHSGSSVSPQIEFNIRDRVEKEGCHGFIAFYSTLPSASLSNILNGLKKIEVQIYDYEKIEAELLKSIEGKTIAQRYFPGSFKQYEKEIA